ncbi:hypothetical protein [Dactylosporangium sp. CA-092794]|uniref:hypothetical protein n=1 Tax=Dactylosporangium sp. CA-092794 TaxID=3239929 RepID=UPI003D8E52D0
MDTSIGITASALPDQTSTDAARRAERYWRVVCAVTTSHLLGTTWPPPGTAQRTRVVGHWGCNPGIAWVTAHLAAHWADERALLMVVGTGHASSFRFAHEAVRERTSATAISAATARYGQPGGDPSEWICQPGVPYTGGELGPALAVSQGLAAGDAAPLVACVVGDGECETPAALAALAHADVLLKRGGAPWLPIVNANGARMGGPARLQPTTLRRILHGFGYEVVQSGADLTEASSAAAAVLASCLAGRRVAWVSVTEKGWPAPELIDGHRYRGHAAHKAPPMVRQGGARPSDVAAWFACLEPDGLLKPTGEPIDDVVRLARRVALTLPDQTLAPEALRPPAPAIAGPGRRTAGRAWRQPMSAVDAELAVRPLVVFSPDEADSNGLQECLRAGTVVEVLAEETCAAWLWGCVEAGRPAVFATYEAFAPIAASLVAQYAKMIHARPARPIPPFTVLATSLGWANAPTHQNTDLTGVLLARPIPQVSVVYPVGAASAGRRMAALADRRRSGVALIVCSKQRLLDLPDPGGPVISYRVAGMPPPSATLVVIGDVCATEAVGAAAIAAQAGLGVEVLAVVDVAPAAGALSRLAARLGTDPLIGATSAAAHHLTTALWQPLNRLFPVHGYAEQYAPTAWETLQANRLDRISLLEALRDEGAPIPAELLDEHRRHLERRLLQAKDLTGVLPFDCPPLQVQPLLEAR